MPARYAWPVMRPLKGAELAAHYVEALRALGTEKGFLEKNAEDTNPGIFTLMSSRFDMALETSL